MSPRNRLAQLYPQALGSLFVSSYDSQGCGGGILTHLHTGFDAWSWSESYLKVQPYLIENTPRLHNKHQSIYPVWEKYLCYSDRYMKLINTLFDLRLSQL
jgi:hypothetical protein